MGLLDVLNGMQNGPRGQTDPNAKGGMSPITMAILALLAYKGIKHLAANPTSSAAPVPQGSGSLGDLLKGGLGGSLGGLLAGGSAGSILSGGLGSLLNQFQQSGLGDVAKSWVATGPNQQVSVSDLAKAINPSELDAILQHTGLTRDQLLSALQQELPKAIDELTPNGRVPTGAELSQRL
jgi:uncharacterized protein YidB (DUF937 family)